MHTIEMQGYVIHFNSDYSGDISFNFSGTCIAELPGYLILALAAEYIRNKRISQIENMATEDLLLGK